MAKRKVKRKKLHQPPTGLQTPPSRSQDPCAQRLSNLALEIALTGAQVLREDFDFDENQANQWLDKMLARAQQNRDGK
jgi:hypothetical protein